MGITQIQIRFKASVGALRRAVVARYVMLGFLLIALLRSTMGVAGVLPSEVDGQALPSLAPILERVTPAVVNISTVGRVSQSNGLMDDPFFRRFFDIPDVPAQRAPQSLGSGVIIDADNGYIVTNNHVIDSASEILITLSDGREASASVIGTDPRADVALIQIELDDLTQIEWADSDAVRVGDFCIAIGNPFGLGQTVTSGIVSALGRSGLGIEDLEDFIQTDASINPGNSGGALIDLSGKLIGINTAIVGPSGGNVGIGFAIPSNMTIDIIDQLVTHGRVRRGQLGITAQAITPRLAEAFGLNAKYGVVIASIQPGSPADKAGLKVGDVITRIDNRPVRDIRAVKNRIGLVRMGQMLKLSVIRNGQSMDINASIERVDNASALLQGAVFADETARNGRAYVVIESIEPGSVMDSYGFQAGDIVLSVNQQYVESVDALEIAAAQSPASLLLLVQRGQATQYFRLQ